MFLARMTNSIVAVILVCFDSMLDRRKFLLKADDMEMVNDEYQYIVLAIRNLGFGKDDRQLFVIFHLL